MLFILYLNVIINVCDKYNDNIPDNEDNLLKYVKIRLINTNS